MRHGEARPARGPAQNLMRAGPRQGPARHDQHPAKSTEPRSHVTLACSAPAQADPSADGDLAGWVAAAGHLNAHGMAAAVPADFVGPLRGQGLEVWPAGAAAEESGRADAGVQVAAVEYLGTLVVGVVLKYVASALRRAA